MFTLTGVGAGLNRLPRPHQFCPQVNFCVAPNLAEYFEFADIFVIVA
jgi:hypothetical protein